MLGSETSHYSTSQSCNMQTLERSALEIPQAPHQAVLSKHPWSCQTKYPAAMRWACSEGLHSLTAPHQYKKMTRQRWPPPNQEPHEAFPAFASINTCDCDQSINGQAHISDQEEAPRETLPCAQTSFSADAQPLPEASHIKPLH